MAPPDAHHVPRHPLTGGPPAAALELELPDGAAEDEAARALWGALVRLPSRRTGRAYQYVRTLLDDGPQWTTRDDDLERALEWSPCSFLGRSGLDDADVVEVPAAWVRLEARGHHVQAPEAWRRAIAARLEELRLPPPHFAVGDDRRRITLIWRIRPLRRPTRAEPAPNHAAWRMQLLAWRMLQAKLCIGLVPVGALAERPTTATTLELPHPRARAAYLATDARMLHVDDAAPYLIRDISAPLERLDHPAWRVVRPHEERPRREVLSSTAWLGSSTFLEAAEPKREGERHAAALRQACIMRWAGLEADEIEAELRRWAKGNLDVAGFPAKRGASDELRDIVDWCMAKLMPGGPTTRPADVRGRYTPLEALCCAVLRVLGEERGEWVGTVADLARAATAAALRAGERTVVTPDALKKRLAELEARGIERRTERSGSTWTTRWRLRRSAGPPEPAAAPRSPEPSSPPQEKIGAPTAEHRSEGEMRMSMGALGESSSPACSGPLDHGRSPRRGAGEGSPLRRPRVDDPVQVGTEEGGAGGGVLSVDAMRLLELGASLLLLDPGSKKPAGRWARAQRRRATAAELAEAMRFRPDAGLGLVCGEVSGLVVVDLDDAAAVAWAHERLPPTPLRVRTARGEHWLYRHPGERVPTRRPDVGGPRIDVKGDGSYCVAAGSVHPSGATYEAIGDWAARLEDCPTFDEAWFAPTERPPPDDDDRSIMRRALDAVRSGAWRRVRTLLGDER